MHERVLALSLLLKEKTFNAICFSPPEDILSYIILEEKESSSILNAISEWYEAL
ncbi:MAG TPA: hypothetical protein VH796_02225 [Nitrososphaeraceae archaeon]|jgi:hypothetical protein